MGCVHRCPRLRYTPGSGLVGHVVALSGRLRSCRAFCKRLPCLASWQQREAPARRALATLTVTVLMVAVLLGARWHCILVISISSLEKRPLPIFEIQLFVSCH